MVVAQLSRLPATQAADRFDVIRIGNARSEVSQLQGNRDGRQNIDSGTASSVGRGRIPRKSVSLVRPN